MTGSLLSPNKKLTVNYTGQEEEPSQISGLEPVKLEGAFAPNFNVPEGE